MAFRYDNANINNYANRNNHQRYYLPKVHIKDYNAGTNFYDNNINSDIEKYTELKKVMVGKGDDYATGSLLDYDYFKKNYKLVAIDLSKQKGLDADPRAIQQIQFKCKFDVEVVIYRVFCHTCSRVFLNFQPLKTPQIPLKLPSYKKHQFLR